MALTKAEQEELELLELEEEESRHLAQKSEPVKEKQSLGIQLLKAGLNPAQFIGEKAKELYDNPEQAKELIKKGSEYLPMAGSIVGGAVATPSDVVLGPLGTAAGAGLGAAGGQFAKELVDQLVLDAPQKSTEQILKEAGKEGATSAVLDIGGGLAAKAVTRAATPFGKWLSEQAGKLAEKATGATGKQAEKFSEGAGRRLLDEDLVKAFDSPENIAQRVRAKMDESAQNIDQILKSEKAMDIKIDENKILEPLEAKVKELSMSGSTVDSAQRLQAYIDRVRSAQAARGSSELTPLMAETEKRGWNKSANMWTNAGEKDELKSMYGAYKDAAEKSLGEVSPEVAHAFKKNKEMYGLLNPIEQAASKRASQLNQSPFGGLLDTTAGLYGLSDPNSMTGTAALAIAGRRFISPRLASTAAVGTNVLGKSMQNINPNVLRMVPQLLNQPQPEQPTDRAERINQERKMLKGK